MRINNLSQKARTIAALCVLVFVMVVAELVAAITQDRALEHERTEVVEELSLLRARLEAEVNSTLFLTHGMISYVAINPSTTWANYKAMASELFKDDNHIRNIGLAPNNIVQFVYPLVGNERVLGLDYRNNKDQWAAVKRAIELDKTVVAGPLTLVQGGQGLIARTPIYERASALTPGKERKYWGLASIVIDTQSLFSAVGLAARHGTLDIAVRGRDGLGEKGETFLGREALFAQPDSVKLHVTMSHGSWQIAAVPIGGWGVGDRSSLIVRSIGLAIGAILSILIYVLLTLIHRNQVLALHDPLTKLPNRRLMYDRLDQLAGLYKRNSNGFALLFIDLDGFKAINDRFGHDVGDQVLIEVSERLTALTRQTDTISRVGGDEFVVVLPCNGDRCALSLLVDKISAGLNAPMIALGYEVDIKASVGCACFPEDADTVDALMKLADDKMYETKHSKLQVS
ncbi:MAG: sensor domain-containing diguanylate cyclase [Magnetovibrio sp.]|nr:sensor domain-containing diguanylate cyclase [Magnetovibrio sp.]